MSLEQVGEGTREMMAALYGDKTYEKGALHKQFLQASPRYGELLYSITSAILTTPLKVKAPVVKGAGSTYKVDSAMQAKDIEQGVLVNGVYKVNPTAQNINTLIKPGSNYVGNSKFNGQYMYVVEQQDNLIV